DPGHRRVLAEDQDEPGGWGHVRLQTKSGRMELDLVEEQALTLSFGPKQSRSWCSPARRRVGAAMTERSTSGGEEIAQRDSHQLRRGTLGVLGIAFFVVSAAAPLTA